MDGLPVFLMFMVKVFLINLNINIEIYTHREILDEIKYPHDFTAHWVY
jgi:hypothetical protein